MEVRQRLGSDLSQAAAARCVVREALATKPEVTDGAIEVTMLLVSELVSNALLHAPGAAELTLRVDGDTVLAAVFDGSRDVPTPVEPNVDEGGGFGLWLLEELSQDWGVELDARRTGKTVWFRVPVECRWDAPDAPERRPHGHQRRRRLDSAV